MSPEAADATAAVLGAVRLGRVLDHDQAVPPRDRQDRIHVGRLPVQVHREDRLGALGDRRLEPGGIDA